MTFDPSQEHILQNDRALLRPMTAADYDALLWFSKNEPDLWTYSLLPADGPENLKHYMDVAFDKRTIGDSYPFVVIDQLTKRVAGSTRFYDIQPHHNTLQLGYTWYGSEFQRTGLNRNCKFLLLQFAFETIGVDRVEFRADANNERSITAMKGLGCIEEGILRSNCKGAVGRRSSIVLSILKDEWFGGVKEYLRAKL